MGDNIQINVKNFLVLVSASHIGSFQFCHKCCEPAESSL